MQESVLSFFVNIAVIGGLLVGLSKVLMSSNQTYRTSENGCGDIFVAMFFGNHK